MLQHPDREGRAPVIHLSFDISSADQAARAADICDFIAQTYAESVSSPDTVPTRSRRNRKVVATGTTDSLAAKYNEIAAAQGAPTITEPIAEVVLEQVAEKIITGEVTLAQVETVAEIAADKVPEAEKLVVTEPPHAQVTIAEVVAETPIEPPEPTEAEAMAGPSRADMTAKIKELASGYGFKWVRANVTDVYGRTKLDELTDAEIAVVHAKALADKAPTL